MRRVSILFVALALAGVAAGAQASPITYDFTVTATDGPLAGTTSFGSFSFDSSSITPLAFNKGANLLTALNFTWDGIAYNATTANTGWLYFGPTGDLVQALFGNICGTWGCSVSSGQEQWYVMAQIGGSISYSTPSFNNLGNGTVTLSRVVVDPGVPEPLTLSLFAAGLIGAGAAGRRRRTA